MMTKNENILLVLVIAITSISIIISILFSLEAENLKQSLESCQESAMVCTEMYNEVSP